MALTVTAVCRFRPLFTLLLAGTWTVPSLATAQSVAPVEAPQPAQSIPGEEDSWVQELDPDTPLAPLPEMEVDWPDLDTPLPPLPPIVTPPPTELVTPVAEGSEPVVVDALPLPGDEMDLALPPPIDPMPANGAETVAATADAPPDPAYVTVDGEFRYRVQLGDLGAANSAALRVRFDGLSALRAADPHSANAAQLNRRINEDTDLINRLLRNAGYYDGTVLSSVIGADQTITVRFDAIPGEVYRYDQVRLNGLDLVGAEEAARLAPAFQVASGEVIDAYRLVAAQAALSTELLETGYPFADVGEELITIDHDTRLGDLDQPVTPGDRLRFGAIIANDHDLLGARHIQRIARFRPGDWYRQSRVDDLRRALIATGLVASVDLTPVRGADGTVDLNVAIEPAPARTIAAAIGYSSGEGFRVEGTWEHRNLFPPEGALIVRGVLGTQEQLASVTYRRNNFMRRDWLLSVQALVSNLDRVGFEARTALFSARLERQSTLLFQKLWTWSIGFELGATQEIDNRRIAGGGRETYFIGGLPLLLGYDRSDSLLDPTRGFRVVARISPEVSIRGDAFPYVRAQIDGSVYQPVTTNIVAAGRVRLATIAGSSVIGIAPSRRYYAGGGGSVRGFGYQRIGPVGPGGDPVGGRSLFEAAAEVRVRTGLLGGNVSVVPFIDVGNVYLTEYPDFSGLRVGAGVGIRYHSSFGPLRVDVGTPLNPRAGDSRIGVYVSLGQAF
jgi:translocation and assembly module TamA